jgi:hypothetical protein
MPLWPFPIALEVTVNISLPILEYSNWGVSKSDRHLSTYKLHHVNSCSSRNHTILAVHYMYHHPSALPRVENPSKHSTTSMATFKIDDYVQYRCPSCEVQQNKMRISTQTSGKTNNNHSCRFRWLCLQAGNGH